MQKFNLIVLSFLLIGFLIISLTAPLRAREDLSSFIQFHDSRKLPGDPKPGDVWSLFTSKPWKEEEKDLIITSLLFIKDKAPGLFHRATAYRPIRLYRATQLGRENVPAMTLQEQNAFLIGDPFFSYKETSNGISSQTLALTHELVHLADQFGITLEKKEWLDLVEPAIERVKQNLEKIKPGLNVHRAEMEGSYRDIAIKEGFPSLWAALSKAEALAEYTVALLFKKDYKVPEKIQTFIHANILVTPFMPDQSMKTFHQGLKDLEDEQFDNAMASFNKGVKLNPKFGSLYQYRAKIWAKKNEVEKAINDYTEAMRLNPDSEKFFERGLLYTKKKETDKAIADYSEYIRRVPWLEKGYEQRAMEWLRKGDIDKAIADISEILRVNSKLTHYFGFRGDLWAAKKDLDKAIADYSELIKSEPLKSSNAAKALLSRGIAWEGKKEYEKAIADFQEAVKINPAYAVVYHKLASILATSSDSKIRDGHKAIEYATKACELTGWKESFYLATLASAYAEAGEFEEAVKWQTKVVEMVISDSDKKGAFSRLELYKAKKPFHQDEKN